MVSLKQSIFVFVGFLGVFTLIQCGDDSAKKKKSGEGVAARVSAVIDDWDGQEDWTGSTWEVK